jgi:LEA14-like dessication related protein
MRKYLFFVLIIPFLAVCKSPPQVIQPVTEIQEIEIIDIIEINIPIIDVIEPDFKIVSIAVIQADLINTEFEAVLMIDNPNEFPVELSSISYELHGNGMFWADGNETGILQIPAKSFSETKFYFTMNFINMNRKILDDVIKMRDVQYRFKGDVEIKAAISSIPAFSMVFDCSGLSEVKQKTDRS